MHISIHPPREGWDISLRSVIIAEMISIHPPREGWDVSILVLYTQRCGISIHPPREGWDSFRPASPLLLIYFNPPTP